MKKATKLFLAVAVLFCTVFMLGGCALEDLTAPKNKWVEYEYPYEYGSGTLVLRGYMYYTDTPRTVETYKKDANNQKVTVPIPAGLTMIVAPKNYSDTDGVTAVFGQALLDKQYIIKSFEKGEKVDIAKDGNNNDGAFNMGYRAWSVMYYTLMHTNVQSGDPDILKEGTYLSLENFKWKKLMYAMAFNKLTELMAAED